MFTSLVSSEKSSGNNRKALAGVKVLEWSEMVAGPYCSRLLADLGAEVIKLEKPEVGDKSRSNGPFVHDVPHPEHSLLFLYLNANKLGITLDVESHAEREKFIELVKWADIFIEDNTPKIMERLKLTYEYLRGINPRLIMTSITPFGQTGPYRNYKAYPINVHHSGGLGYYSPNLSGESIQTPLKFGGFFTEYSCGLVSAVGTLAALYDQQTTGLGQQVDISKQEAVLSLCRVQAGRYPNLGVIQSRLDNYKARGGVYHCKDGHVIEATNQSHEWKALAKLLGKPEWVEDERYLDLIFRQDHWDEILQDISSWMANHTKEEIHRQGQTLGCSISPIMTAEDIVNSTQSIARGFFTEIAHPVVGSLKYPTTPYHFSVTPSSIERPAPLLGQHTHEVFSNLLNSNQQDLKPAQVTVQPSKKKNQERQKPLKGIRIADFSWAWAGAHSTELLAFLGAEVIKVESLQRIDFTRLWSFTVDQQFASLEESCVFNDINLGKLGIKLNLSQPKAIELAKKLVSMSDVVVQNMRPGIMERLGLGYEALKEIRPDIIYLSSSARGTFGPEHKYHGYAPNFAALGGISHITGNPNGTPPFMMGEIDLISAVTAAFAMLAALNHRRKTGQGQHIDLSSSEAINVLIGDVLMDYIANGRVQSRKGNLDGFMAPHNCYRCKGEDEWISIAIATDEEWQALCKALGDPDWTKKQLFATAPDRQQNQEELDKLIGKWTIDYTHYEIMDMLQKVGVAAMPCFSSKDIFHNPHLSQRQCWTKVIHPVMGEQSVVTPPWKFSATPAEISSSSPLLGQHSNQIFKDLFGMTDAEIISLEKENVIY